MKLTEWFAHEVKPELVGIYERSSINNAKSGSYYFWNGEFWEFGGVDSPEAVKRSSMPTCSNYDFWRGLAEKPE